MPQLSLVMCRTILVTVLFLGAALTPSAGANPLRLARTTLQHVYYRSFTQGRARLAEFVGCSPDELLRMLENTHASTLLRSPRFEQAMNRGGALYEEIAPILSEAERIFSRRWRNRLTRGPSHYRSNLTQLERMMIYQAALIEAGATTGRPLTLAGGLGLSLGYHMVPRRMLAAQMRLLARLLRRGTRRTDRLAAEVASSLYPELQSGRGVLARIGGIQIANRRQFSQQIAHVSARRQVEVSGHRRALEFMYVDMDRINGTVQDAVNRDWPRHSTPPNLFEEGAPGLFMFGIFVEAEDLELKRRLYARVEEFYEIAEEVYPAIRQEVPMGFVRNERTQEIRRGHWAWLNSPFDNPDSMGYTFDASITYHPALADLMYWELVDDLLNIVGVPTAAR